MGSALPLVDLIRWGSIAAEELAGHPEAKLPIRIWPDAEALFRAVADIMVTDVVEAETQHRLLKWVLPVGPTGQFPYFIRRVNEERISLQHVHIFHMDEMLDWTGAPVPYEHPFNFRRYMTEHLYEPIAPELRPPVAQRYFPTPQNVLAIAEQLESLGGADVVYGGIGYRGHLAMNEAWHHPWTTVTVEDIKAARARIVTLNDDTMVALSQRDAGGLSHIVPPMAVTLGMGVFWRAGSVRMLSVTGAWKRAVVRILAFGPVTAEYPVTLLQQHPDASLWIDANTAAPCLPVSL